MSRPRERQNKMKWLTNHYMPKDAPRKTFSLDSLKNEHWEREWLKDKIIGRPKATAAYTVEQQYVGVYAREDE